MGIQFGFTVALFALAGVWLDKKFESLAPLFTVLLSVLGFVGATVSLVARVLGPEKKEKQEK